MSRAADLPKNCDPRNIGLRVTAWFQKNRRPLPWRENPTPYRVWISEVMLQQTVVNTVTGYFDRWMERFPDVAALAQAGEDEVLTYWEGLGYYSRARNILKAARLIMSNHGGRVPDEYGQLRALPGIGDYTACAILSLAHDR
ncbi:MAG TPA: A/G-specific adenine glycosylase, partial [Candidatus Sumerlaeota bacterium]|nr:A/G-specific adenine glycosylase [Candidatus Sumerlaeota bacterium]